MTQICVLGLWWVGDGVLQVASDNSPTANAGRWKMRLLPPAATDGVVGVIVEVVVGVCWRDRKLSAHMFKN